MGKNRRRGAQPDNTNALKHGLYSSRLSADQRIALVQARALDPQELTEEIALLRARLALVLETQPHRFDLVVVGLRTLAHLVALRHRLEPRAAEDLATAIANVVEGVGGLLLGDEPPPE